MKRCALLLLLLPLHAVAGNPPAPGPAAPPSEAAADPAQPPRKSYNQARAAFTQSDLAKAEAGFLSARDHAEGDDEVRYRAAFNLALTLAQKAAGLTKEKPQDALTTLQQSAAWFRDAVRSRPDDADARVNLEIILRRMQQLADQLNKGQNSLEARLGRVIQDERTLRDRVRGLLMRINQAGVASEPLNFQSEFEDSSTFQRTLLSDAGAVLDLAGDERDHLSQKAEKDRSPEDQGRLVQLKNLEPYLDLARGTMADVARLLRRLQGDRAHRQSDVAVTQLKRALEQLQDPVTVLKGLTADQTTTLSQTRALDEIRARKLQLAAPQDVAKDAAKAAPAWLTTGLLLDQQKELRPRASELLMRLEAGVKHETSTPPPDPTKPKDPREEAQRKQLLEGARQAIPLIQEGLQAMERASAALAGEQLQPATRAQIEALAALFKALERFSGIRDLIELAYGEQAQLATLLSPEAKAQLGSLPAPERTKIFTDGATHNQDRLGRLKGLFADELVALAAPPKAPQGQAGGQAGGPPQDDAEKRAAEKQRFELAEQKRQLAEAAVLRLATLLTQKNANLQPTVEEGRRHLEELRRLFFSVVEHLKELLRNQTETHDRTSSAQAQKDPAERQRKLGPLAEAEAGHETLGKAVAEALAAQADQAGNASEPQAKQAQKQLADAAEEVKKAHGAMSEATRLLREGDQHAQSLPVDLEPPLEQQKQALAHLEAAIRILEPPQENQQQKQNQQQQDEKQLSQEQAARRLQAIREREAERQRKRQPAGRPEPVEKDW
jgi:hypothetical protein